MTAATTERPTGITPAGVALAEVFREHHMRKACSTNDLVAQSSLDHETVRAIYDGRGEPGIDDLSAAEAAFGLEPGQLTREAIERTVPIVCPAWCAFDDYAGDGVVVHFSRDLSIPTANDLLTPHIGQGTYLDGTPCEDDPVPLIHIGDNTEMTAEQAEQVANSLLELVREARA
jgi:hypothetical protein